MEKIALRRFILEFYVDYDKAADAVFPCIVKEVPSGEMIGERLLSLIPSSRDGATTYLKVISGNRTGVWNGPRYFK